jgi:hypothetical protein
LDYLWFSINASPFSRKKNMKTIYFVKDNNVSNRKACKSLFYYFWQMQCVPLYPVVVELQLKVEREDFYTKALHDEQDYRVDID